MGEGRARAQVLGSSGIKFEVEGGEGSAGADTYIPASFLLHFSQQIAILQHFSEIFRKIVHVAKIPKNVGQNLARFSKNSAKCWQILQNFV